MCVPIPINQPTLILNQPPKSLLNCDRNELGWVGVLTKVKQCPWFQIIHSSSMKMVSTYYSFVFSYHLVHEEREGASTYITLHIMIIPLPFSCENSFIWSIYIFSKATHLDVLLGFFFSTNFQFRYGQSTL